MSWLSTGEMETGAINIPNMCLINMIFFYDVIIIIFLCENIWPGYSWIKKVYNVTKLARFDMNLI